MKVNKKKCISKNENVYTKKNTKYNRQLPLPVPKEEKELEKALEEWSEGNIYLKKCLKMLNENGFETFACCKGHLDRNILYAYIGLKFKEYEEKSEFYHALVYEMLKKGFKVRLDNYASDKKKYLPRIYIYIETSKRNEGFNLITTILKKYILNNLDVKIDQNIIYILNFFFKYMQDYYMNFNMGYEKDNIVFIKYKHEKYIELDKSKYAKKISEEDEIYDEIVNGKYIGYSTGKVFVRYEIHENNIKNTFKI